MNDVHQNQIHPPLPKKKRVDDKGNSYVRVIAKDGGASMIVVENLTENAAEVFINKISEVIGKLGGKQKTTFKIIR
jgi:hypothetical protein